MNTAVEAINLSYHYDDGVQALCDVSFSVFKGERVAIVGGNGAGKSTLLKHFVGLLLPSSGGVEICGSPLSSRSLEAAREKIGYLFQNSDDQLLLPRVRDDVGFALSAKKIPFSELDRRVQNALAAVGISHLSERFVHRLSGGEKRLVTLAGVLVQDPQVLLLDEPTANLDPKARRNFVTLIREMSQAVLLVTHDLDLASQLCSRVIVMHEGRIAREGLAQAVLSDKDFLQNHGL
jgi:cobalt/nickel transport system ATP-binding protein